MRTFGILIICCALLPQVASARQKRPTSVVAIPIAGVVSAGPEANAKTFRLELRLKDGRRVAYQFNPADADAVSNGLSNPAVVVGQKVNVSRVYGMQIYADPQQQAVIVIPRTKDRTLESLAIPLTAADNLVKTLQEKFAEVKASVAKHGSQPHPNLAAPEPDEEK